MKNFATMCVGLLMAFAGLGLSSGVSLAADEPAKAASVDYVQVYYFHATNRCKTCTTLEQYSRESVDAYFKEQLGNGTLRFKEVNFDEPDNRHFLQDYNLLYRSLVIVLFKDGKQVKFKNLEKIWQLVNNKPEYLDYVKTEVEAMLKEL